MAASTGWDEAVYRGLGELLNLLDQAEPDPGGLPSWAQAYPAELWLVLRRAVESRNLDTFSPGCVKPSTAFSIRRCLSPRSSPASRPPAN